MGGLRAASQIISYELAMGISLISLLMFTGSLSLKENGPSATGRSLEYRISAAGIPDLPGVLLRNATVRLSICPGSGERADRGYHRVFLL